MTTTETTHWSDWIADLDPCVDALAWCREQPDARTAWRACERGDWLLWILGRTSCSEHGSEPHRVLVLAACACARLALVHVPPGEQRPLAAIQTAEAWARRDPGVTLADVLAAAEAAEAAAWAAAAWAAARAAARAARAAEAAAWAAADAEALTRCAEIVRGFFPDPPVRP